KQAMLEAVIMQWKENLGTQSSFTVQQVLDRASKDVDFNAALMNVAASRGGGTGVSNVRVGRWLARVEGKIVQQQGRERGGNGRGYPLWQLFEMGQSKI